MIAKEGWKKLCVAGAGVITAALTAGACLFHGTALMNAMVRIWLFPLIGCVVAVTVLAVRPAVRRENLFLALALGLGMGYLFAITPLAAPDEWFHYNVVLSMSGKLLYGRCAVDASYLTPDGFTPTISSVEAFMTMTQGLNGTGLSGVMTDFEPMTCNYSLIYWPQVVGASLAMLLGLNRQWLFLLGDLVNLLCYTGLTYLAIRRIPKGKLTLMLAALTPMALHQAASLSPDGLLNGLAFLLFAQIMACILDRKPMKWPEIFVIGVTALLFAPAKAVYYPMLLLLCFTPRERFAKPGRKWWFVGGILAAAAVACVLVQVKNLATSIGHGADSPYYTLSWVLRNPFKALFMLMATLRPTAFQWYVETAVGSSLCSLNLSLATGSIWCYIMLLLFSAVCWREGEEPLRRPLRLTMLGTAVVVIVAVFGVMLLSWTHVGSKVIDGVQGRYFIPVMPMVLLAFNGGGVRAKRDYTLPVVGAWCFLSIYSLYQVCSTMVRMAAG